MHQLHDQKEINKYIWLFSLTYMISYMTRINYGAVILEIENATQMSKTLLSMAITGSAITYGTGQIISGICGDRISPKKLISYGLILTVLMNLLLPFCQSPYQMLAVWCVNGFAQSFMWPPMVRLMSALFTMETYKKASVRVSWGSSVGTILVYLLSPLMIATVGWKAVFWGSALCGVVMILIWNRFCCDIDREPVQKGNGSAKAGWRIVFSPLMLAVMLAIVMQGMLRDGVTTWMPTYISETYHLSSVISILTSVILPIFSILCYEAAARLYRKYFKNPLQCAGVIFAVSTVAALVLYLSTGQNAAASAGFAALLTGCMHGVNVILICMIPPFFQKYGNVSTVSGVLNSCTYIGSALSTYGTAFLAEHFSWNTTILAWMLIALIGTAICFLCVKPWSRREQEQV